MRACYPYRHDFALGKVNLHVEPPAKPVDDVDKLLELLRSVGDENDIVSVQ